MVAALPRRTTCSGRRSALLRSDTCCLEKRQRPGSHVPCGMAAPGQRWRSAASCAAEWLARSGLSAARPAVRQALQAEREALLSAGASCGEALHERPIPASAECGEVDDREAMAGLVAAMQFRIAAAAAAAAAAPRKPAAPSQPAAAAAVAPAARTAAGRAAGAFRSVEAPALDLRDYAARLRRSFRCSSECFVICAAYLDRLDRRHPGITDMLSCHRLLLCSLMLAVKFHDDEHYVNSFYAEVGGVSLAELNALELVMMRLLDFRLHMFPEDFEVYRALLVKAAVLDTTK